MRSRSLGDDVGLVQGEVGDQLDGAPGPIGRQLLGQPVEAGRDGQQPHVDRPGGEGGGADGATRGAGATGSRRRAPASTSSAQRVAVRVRRLQVRPQDAADRVQRRGLAVDQHGEVAGGDRRRW